MFSLLPPVPTAPTPPLPSRSDVVRDPPATQGDADPTVPTAPRIPLPHCDSPDESLLGSADPGTPVSLISTSSPRPPRARTPPKLPSPDRTGFYLSEWSLPSTTFRSLTDVPLTLDQPSPAAQQPPPDIFPPAASQPPAVNPDPVSPTATAYAPQLRPSPLPVPPRTLPRRLHPGNRLQIVTPSRMTPSTVSLSPTTAMTLTTTPCTGVWSLPVTSCMSSSIARPPATSILPSPRRETSAGSALRRPYSPPQLPYSSPALTRTLYRLARGELLHRERRAAPGPRDFKLLLWF